MTRRLEKKDKPTLKRASKAKPKPKPKKVVEEVERKISPGDRVLLDESVKEYATGGIIRTRLRNKPCRVQRISPSGENVLLSAPVLGWVPIDKVARVDTTHVPAAIDPRKPAPRKTIIKPEELQILLPVTRKWSIERVCRSLGASDIPRGEVILVLDAPDCFGWVPALEEIGFTVKVHATENCEPPKGRIERRKRHREMRILTQSLVWDGHLLLLEDDTLVPPDVFSRLEAHKGSVSGVQVSRHDREMLLGIHGAKLKSQGVEPIEACGHYCLLTTGAEYKKAKFKLTNEAVDWTHTSQIRPLSVDWSVVCGHLLEDGTKLVPDGTKLGVVKEGGRPLIVGALVHMYPPHHNAGAEHMLHAIFSEMVSLGHEARVVINQGHGRKPLGIKSYDLDGVSVSENINDLNGIDVLFTHLDRTREAEAWSTAKHVPLAQIFHNNYQPVNAHKCDLAVYNSHWLAQMYPCDFPSIVIHPPVDLESYAVEREDDLVTLINLSAPKGANIFYGLAERMPDVRFLGVKGAYGAQIVRDDLENVEIIECQPDVREVYRRTGVLLVPSVYESYGRVAVEACASGIPVIANSTPGLKEALGECGIYPKRIEPLVFDTSAELSLDNLDAWEQTLREVLANRRGQYSQRAAQLETDPHSDVLRLIGALETVRR